MTMSVTRAEAEKGLPEQAGRIRCPGKAANLILERFLLGLRELRDLGFGLRVEGLGFGGSPARGWRSLRVEGFQRFACAGRFWV